MRGELQQRKRTKAKEKSRGWESNPQPTVYKTVALPVELPRRKTFIYFSIFCAISPTSHYATIREKENL